MEMNVEMLAASTSGSVDNEPTAPEGVATAISAGGGGGGVCGIFKSSCSCTSLALPHASSSNSVASTTTILNLPCEVLEHVLHFISSPALASLARTSKVFRARDSNGMSLVEKASRDQLLRLHGPGMAARWRVHSWLGKLRIEEAGTRFDAVRSEKQGFTFSVDPVTSKVVGVKLEGIGPKLLVSEVSTADVPLLRWRLEIKGNNAVEFGTVPVTLQDQPKSLHKCYQDGNGERPSGFYSAITIGSLLPVKLPLMRGSIVEILASRDRLDFIVTHPRDGSELTWKNAVTVPTMYKGPRELRFQQDLSPDCPVKLAVTCWARSSFTVLHSHSTDPVMDPSMAAASRNPDKEFSNCVVCLGRGYTGPGEDPRGEHGIRRLQCTVCRGVGG